MRIEITDREHWLERVNAAISRIETERKKRDMEYVDEWRASVFGGRLLLMLNPAANPPSNWRTGYPSVYGWDDYGTLLDMRAALLSLGTGRIWFGETEMNAAPAIAEQCASLNRYFSARIRC